MASKSPNNTMKKRLVVLTLCLAFFGFIVVAIRLFYMQVINYEFYEEKAIEQQTKDKVVSPKRGTIYDRNMKELAISASTEMITVDPKNIVDESKVKKLEEGKEGGLSAAQQQEKAAKMLSEVLELNYDTVYKKVTKNSSYEIIKKGVEKDVADKIRQLKTDENITGIYFTDDNKRYYPYGNFASHIIGFTGSDGYGLYGIEASYEEVLKGTAGRVIKAQNAIGKDMPFDYEKYVPAQDGNGVVLTIDEGVQHFLEKHLETARAEHKTGNGVAGIVMDVKTGEIIAMSAKPDYDVNSPYQITDSQLTTELRTSINQILTDAGLSASAVQDEYLKNGTTAAMSGVTDDEVKKNVKAQRSKALEKMWRNKPIQDLYEPGSTFKLFTMSTAVEEGLINANTTFNCPGYKIVGDRRIKCWKHGGHGTQVTVKALQNSCNPAHMEIGLKIGSTKFREYFEAYGMTEKTGIDLPGEASGIFHDKDSFGEVDLATASFGQNFSVTPMQMITMVSAIVDDGKLKKPHLVKEIVDTDGNVKETIKPEIIRQVISEDTSKFMREAMEAVVATGTGQKAYVAGYRVGGKTATSEKYPRGNGKYIASFIGVAPMDDPQYAVLVMIDEPIGGSTSGGGAVAAPVVGNIFTDMLPYLGVEPKYDTNELSRRDITVPNVIGKTLDEAKALLKSKEVAYKVIGDGDTVTDQIPASGVKVPANATAIIYMGQDKSEELITVPNVVGLSVTEANNVLKDKDLYMKTTGVSAQQTTSATRAAKQSPVAGTKVNIGTVITVQFSNNTNLGE